MQEGREDEVKEKKIIYSKRSFLLPEEQDAPVAEPIVCDNKNIESAPPQNSNSRKEKE